VLHLKRLFKRALEGEAFLEVSRCLKSGAQAFSIAGPTGGAKALAIAHAILAAPQSVMVLAPTGAAAQTLADELRFFLGLFAARPPRVIHMPSPEVDPYRGLSPHPDVAAARAQALWQLLQAEATVCVTSVHSAALRLHPPQHFLQYCLELKTGNDYAPEGLRRHLQNTGYIEDDPVTEPGEFSLRGGILDVFPPHFEQPVRLEFFGDRLESMRTFDADSQRSVGPIGRAQIIPMREYCAGPETFERWAREFPAQWSQPFLPFIEEELARARQGEPFPAFEFLLPAVEPLQGTLFDYLRGYRLVVCDREIVETTLARYHSELYARYVDRVEAQKPVLQPEQLYVSSEEFRSALNRLPCLEVDELGVDSTGGPQAYIAVQATRKYHGNIGQLMGDLNKFSATGEDVVLLFSNLGRAERVSDILREYEIPSHLCRDEADGNGDLKPGTILLGIGALHAGFFLHSANLRVLTGSEVFDEVEVGAAPMRARRAQRAAFLSDFRDLKCGDYVVHVDHGIGQFLELKQISTQEGAKEFVLLAYQDEARLYVPVERLDLIQKYSSVGGTRPSLDRLGGTSWHRTKSRIKKSMRDMAGELLRLYAERQMVEGFGYSPDSAWQQEFEDSFEFELTRDQNDAIQAVKHDMEAARPMDRLVCGDVGYGKTEVAMRAAFKAVMDGKQVAVLAPTTVLAFQHHTTFRQRFTAFPIRIELLSRFRSPKEQKQVIGDLETGTVDIVVGTHRLLSKDVSFKDLGLVVVDEEQRFGVAHKERLKALKTRVDVLTLSATPIPRTLHMALMGLRDMSTIETPPKNRLAIQTSVVRFNPDVIRSAIELELARSGQVYYVHNRVETIYPAAAVIQRLVPQARIGVAHGQMSERELEKVMLRFVIDELDVLVATTIIENGLDIPRVNTIIIDRADLYGMSQLYQLRGRVGRSDRRAYAYLLIQSDEVLSDVARKRLAAIREFSDLGTGFRVAALDLEIRGAGNMLGGEQHGHINAVGFDLYCRLLEQSVQELRGLKVEEEVSTSINLNLDIRIPEDYIPDQSQRLRMYKRISSARDTGELEALQQEMIDRFGRYPHQVENLFRYARLRQYALELQIQSIERSRDQIFFRMLDHSKVSPERLLKLVGRNRRASFSPQGLLTLEAEDLPPAELFEAIHRILDAIRAE
jgi:transcription-repair coupling factor (superfamily II helicase)